MKNRKLPEKCKNKWVLFNKDNKILYCSKDIVKVIDKGEEYKKNKVFIQKGIEKGTCFF